MKSKFSEEVMNKMAQREKSLKEEFAYQEYLRRRQEQTSHAHQNARKETDEEIEARLRESMSWSHPRNKRRNDKSRNPRNKGGKGGSDKRRGKNKPKPGEREGYWLNPDSDAPSFNYGVAGYPEVVLSFRKSSTMDFTHAADHAEWGRWDLNDDVRFDIRGQFLVRQKVRTRFVSSESGIYQSMGLLVLDLREFWSVLVSRHGLKFTSMYSEILSQYFSAVKLQYNLGEVEFEAFKEQFTTSDLNEQFDALFVSGFASELAFIEKWVPCTSTHAQVLPSFPFNEPLKVLNDQGVTVMYAVSGSTAWSMFNEFCDNFTNQKGSKLPIWVAEGFLDIESFLSGVYSVINNSFMGVHQSEKEALGDYDITL